MFGANYSRTMFWMVSIIAALVGGFLLTFVKVLAEVSGNDSLETIFTLILIFILINTLANRIRDYGSNPWLALWSLLPLVGFVQVLYFGIKHKKSVSGDQNASFSSQSSQQQQPKSPEIKDFHYTPKYEAKPEANRHTDSNTSSAPRPRLPLKDFN